MPLSKQITGKTNFIFNLKKKAMRSLHITRPILSAAILTIAFLSVSFTTNADDHKNERGHKKHNRYEYREGGNYRAHYNDREYKGKGNYKHHKDYKYDSDYKAYKNDDCGYYNHPRYGRVYQRFEHKPYVLKHSRGNYYYSDNRFYTYRDGIGYCVAEPPRHVYFRELPFRCTRIYANGCEYYRSGDLFFRLSARGYVIVPAPLEVNVSVRF